MALYSFYLNSTQSNTDVFSCSPVTVAVSQHAEKAAELLGYQVDIQQNELEYSLSFEVNGKLVAKIVEGCTSIAIMILFLSFIIAFSGKITNTLIFGLSGIFLIYLVNIFRIVFMAIIIYHYPEYTQVLHDIVFPGMIYGIVFILWMIWVNKFALIHIRDA